MLEFDPQAVAKRAGCHAGWIEDGRFRVQFTADTPAGGTYRLERRLDGKIALMADEEMLVSNLAKHKANYLAHPRQWGVPHRVS